MLSDNGRLQVTASTSSICVKIPHHQLASSLRPLRLRSFTVRDLSVEAMLSALRLLALLSCGEVFVNGHEVSKSDFDKSKEETNSNRHDSCQRWIVFTFMQLSRCISLLYNLNSRCHSLFPILRTGKHGKGGKRGNSCVNTHRPSLSTWRKWQLLTAQAAADFLGATHRSHSRTAAWMRQDAGGGHFTPGFLTFLPFSLVSVMLNFCTWS